MRARAQVLKASANLSRSARIAVGDNAPFCACKWADYLPKPPHTAKPGRRQPCAIAVQCTEHQEPVRLGRGTQSEEVRGCETANLSGGLWRVTLEPVREGQEREAHQGGSHENCHVHAKDGSGAQGEKTESRMRGCGVGGNTSHERGVQRESVVHCATTLGRHASPTPSLLVTFLLLAQRAPVCTPPPHAMVGGSLVVVKRPHPHLRPLESPTFIMRPPHAPKSYLSRQPIHFHQPAAPNDDEHELHRRLRSQKASNRSFFSVFFQFFFFRADTEMGGGGTESFFGNAAHMHTPHTTHNTQHTHRHKHKHKHTAIGVAGGVLTVLYQSLDIPLEAGTRGISVEQRSNLLLFWESL